MTDKPRDDELSIAEGVSTRRTLLRLGAAAVPAIVTIKPAWATGGGYASLAMCRIPFTIEVDEDGKPRNGNGQGGTYYAPPSKGYYYGQELIDYQAHGALPDGIYASDQFEAHLNYIKTLKPGDSGFTCLTSLVHKL